MLPVQPSRRPALKRTRLLAIGALSLGLATTTACGVSDSGGGEAAGSTLRVVLPQEPPTLESCDASNTGTGVVVRSNITEPLMERDATTGDLKPLLATSWKQTTPKVWTIKLEKGVTFSDGSAFDAKSAKHSIDRAVNSKLGCFIEGYVFGDADLDVKVVDDTTLTVATEAPDPILPLRVSFVEQVPTSTSDAKKVREPIGTGPFKIDTWDAGQKLTLARNATYWGDKPAFAKVTYVWRTEGTVRAAMVTNGEADVATGIGPDDGAGDLGVKYPNNETTALRIQIPIAPLDDIRVRQAINYAVDRQGIIDSLFNGDGEAAAQLVPDGVVGFNPDLEPWPTDPAKAKELLAEAKADGVDLSKEIKLIGRTAQFPKIEEVIQVIQKELTDIGLKVKIEMVDTAQSTAFQQRPFPTDSGPYLLMIQHGNQAGDAAFSLEQYMLSNGFQSAGGSAAFDKQIKAAGTLTGDARQAAYAKVFAEEPEAIGQFAYIAHMTGMLAKAKTLDYTPSSSTGDEMRLAEMKPAS